jgi:hypothetical protein
MASTVFKVVSWSPNDIITDEKLGAMVNNDEWLRDTMVIGKYSGNGVSRDTGVRILSGLTLIPSGKSNTDSKSVSFGNFFTEGCKPIVTTGVMSSSQRQISPTVTGPGTNNQPTRDGMTIYVYVVSSSKKKKITKNFYVSWIALGY